MNPKFVFAPQVSPLTDKLLSNFSPWMFYRDFILNKSKQSFRFSPYLFSHPTSVSSFYLVVPSSIWLLKLENKKSY